MQKEQKEKSRPLIWGDVWLADSYRYLLHPNLLEIPIPRVPRVVCTDCRRVKEGTATWEVRCCDIMPQLPNFLVGEILESVEHPVLVSWLGSRRGDPYGLLAPPEEALRHLGARKDGKFGLPCPMLSGDEGVCSIYWARPALCVGYHCYYPGFLWQEMYNCLATTLDLLQHTTTRHLVAIASFDLEKMLRVWEQFQDESKLWQGESQNEAAYGAFWQDWLGREREFYHWCYTYVTTSTDIRAKVCALRREQLAFRWQDDMSKEARQQALWEESLSDGSISAQAPAEQMRHRYRRGPVAAESNELSILQQESILLWYLQQISQGGAWQRIREWWGRFLSDAESKT